MLLFLSTNKHVNEFDKNGYLIKTYWIQIKEQSQKEDTSRLEERTYNPITGLLDTLIKFDNRPLFTSISCYQYDKQKRLGIILKFGLTEMKHGEPRNGRLGDDQLVGPPQIESDVKIVQANKTCINGRLLDPSAFNIMIKNNDFSSIRYKYYMEDQVFVEEQTELYDFLKEYNKSDTCKMRTMYSTYNGHVVDKSYQFDCKGRTSPSVYYIYKDGLLDSIIDADRSRPKDVQLTYDSRNNLTVLSNIWNGEKVSILELIYDEKGFLKALRRKSTWDNADYFMDNNLVFETQVF